MFRSVRKRKTDRWGRLQGNGAEHIDKYSDYVGVFVSYRPPFLSLLLLLLCTSIVRREIIVITSKSPGGL